MILSLVRWKRIEYDIRTLLSYFKGDEIFEI